MRKGRQVWAYGIAVAVLAASGCVAVDPVVDEGPLEEVVAEELLVDEFVFDEQFMKELVKDPSQKMPQYTKHINATTFQHVYDYYGYEIVTDELGSYRSVKMRLPEPYIEAFPLPWTDKYSQEELRDALRFFTDYALNDLVDSPALDNAEAWWDWWEERGQHFVISDETSYEMFGDSLRQYMVDNKLKVTDTEWADENWTPMVIYSGYTTSVEEGSPNFGKYQHGLLMRDGESRVANRQIFDIDFNLEGEGLWVNAAVGVGVIYDYKKELDAALGQDYIISSGLNAGEVTRLHFGTASFGTYLVLEEDGWKIAGYRIHVTNGADPFPRKELVNNDGVAFHVTEQRPDLRYIGLFD